MTISPSDLRRVANALLPQRWIFAKTMPENPHWYTLRKEWHDDQAFVSTVEVMRRYGYKERFKGRPYTMLNLNGHKYWTMGAPIPATILINRREISAPAPYDNAAPNYDALFSDAESLAQNCAVVKRLNLNSNERILDIGCGTGVLLDTLTYVPENYVGIDPSQAMLQQLREKHPTAQVVHASLEEYVGQDFDCVIGLFGSPNYCTPEHLDAIPSMLRPGGRYALMFYDHGYTPKSETALSLQVRSTPGVITNLPGTTTTMFDGRYILLEGRI